MWQIFIKSIPTPVFYHQALPDIVSSPPPLQTFHTLSSHPKALSNISSTHTLPSHSFHVSPTFPYPQHAPLPPCVEYCLSFLFPGCCGGTYDSIVVILNKIRPRATVPWPQKKWNPCEFFSDAYHFFRIGKAQKSTENNKNVVRKMLLKYKGKHLSCTLCDWVKQHQSGLQGGQSPRRRSLDSWEIESAPTEVHSVLPLGTHTKHDLRGWKRFPWCFELASLGLYFSVSGHIKPMTVSAREFEHLLRSHPVSLC